MRGWILGGAVLIAAVWIYRTVGWIRLEPTIAEQRKRAFANLEPRYRRTCDGKPRWYWPRTTQQRRTA